MLKRRLRCALVFIDTTKKNPTKL